MINTDVLTVAEFRKQMKMALDYCVQGGTIEIERMGQRFLLMSVPRDSNVSLGMPKDTVMVKPPLVNRGVPKNTDVSDLLTPEKIASEPDGSESFPKFGGELPCCINETQPCKHWVWDSKTGEGYVNSLSGRIMEVE